MATQVLIHQGSIYRGTEIQDLANFQQEMLELEEEVLKFTHNPDTLSDFFAMDQCENRFRCLPWDSLEKLEKIVSSHRTELEKEIEGLKPLDDMFLQIILQNSFTPNMGYQIMMLHHLINHLGAPSNYSPVFYAAALKYLSIGGKNLSRAGRAYMILKQSQFYPIDARAQELLEHIKRYPFLEPEEQQEKTVTSEKLKDLVSGFIQLIQTVQLP